MSLFKHQNNMDHLRRRAELHIIKGREQNAPSPASVGHKKVITQVHSTDMRDGLTDTPYLSDMSGAIGFHKP